MRAANHKPPQNSNTNCQCDEDGPRQTLTTSNQNKTTQRSQRLQIPKRTHTKERETYLYL